LVRSPDSGISRHSCGMWTVSRNCVPHRPPRLVAVTIQVERSAVPISCWQPTTVRSPADPTGSVSPPAAQARGPDYPPGASTRSDAPKQRKAAPDRSRLWPWVPDVTRSPPLLRCLITCRLHLRPRRNLKGLGTTHRPGSMKGRRLDRRPPDPQAAVWCVAGCYGWGASGMGVGTQPGIIVSRWDVKVNGTHDTGSWPSSGKPSPFASWAGR